MTSSILTILVLAQAQRAPVPAPDQQTEKEKLVREVFKSEYSKKAPADRMALGKQLLQQATETKDDPAAQYVLLRESRDIAASAGDVSTALLAIEAMAGTFEVDPVRMKLGALTTALQEVRLGDSSKAVAEALLKLVDDAEAIDDVETAEKAAASAMSAARKAKDVPLAARAEARSRDAGQLKTRLSRVKAAQETLAKNPDDPAANLQLGQYFCFGKGNWEAGLPHLAKGSDEALKSLAARDLSNPSSPQDKTGLADSWKEWASKEPANRPRILDRATLWYERALPGATGLLKLKIEKRLGELAGASASSAAREKQLSEGLVGWWKLDEGTGIVADDASGHKNQGKLLGGTEWVPGHLGKALRFNGVDGRVVVEDAPSLRIVDDFTVALWFRRDAAPLEWTRLVGKGTKQARNFGLWVGAPFQRNQWMFQQWDDSNHAVVELDSKSQCENGRWYHLAAVVRGDQASLYVDGIEEISKKRVGKPATSVDPVTFGYPLWDQPLAGVLDDIRIYRRGLSEAEVKLLASMK